MKTTIAMVAALGFGLAAGPAWAQPGPGPENAPPVVKKRILRELGLEAGQIKKIEDLTYRADRKKLDIKHELHKNHLDLQHLMSADKPDQAAVFSMIEKIGKLEVELKKNRVGLMLKIRKLLTPEQWEKLEMFQSHRKAERREKRKRREKRTRRRSRRFDAPMAPEPPPGPPSAPRAP